MAVREQLLLIGSAAAFGVIGAWLSLTGRVNDHEAVELLLLGTLVVVTIVYVARTADIAEATRELARGSDAQLRATLEIAAQSEREADATRRQDTRTRQDMQSGVRPILRFLNEVELDPAGLDVENIGIGPAVNVRSWLTVRFLGGETKMYNTNSQSNPLALPIIPLGKTSAEMGAVEERQWIIDARPHTDDADQVSYVTLYEDVYGNFFRSESQAKYEKGTPGVEKYKIEKLKGKDADHLLEEAGYKE